LVLSNGECAFYGNCEYYRKIIENGSRPVITQKWAFLPFLKAGTVAVPFSIQQVISAWAN
jgi:hypothetical protein